MSGQNCKESSSVYIPTDTSLYPIKYLKIRIWFIENPENPEANFRENDTITYKFISDLLSETYAGTNYYLSHNQALEIKDKSFHPDTHYYKPAKLHLSDTRLRYVLAPLPDSTLDPNQDGIIFLRDKDYSYYAPATSRDSTNKFYRISYPDKNVKTGRTVQGLNKYMQKSKDAINIFIMPIHEFAVNELQKHKQPIRTWGWSQFYSDYIALPGIYQRITRTDLPGIGIDKKCLEENNNDTSKCLYTGWHYQAMIHLYSKLINHEIGHLLGLNHITAADHISGYDCKDTPKVPSVSGKTNNVMDYVHQNNYSPCQLGLIHKTLLCNPGMFIKLDTSALFRYIPEDTIFISRKTIFKDKKYLNKDLFISDTLVVANDLFLPIQAKITLSPTGVLVLQKNIRTSRTKENFPENRIFLQTRRFLFWKKTGQIIKLPTEK